MSKKLLLTLFLVVLASGAIFFVQHKRAQQVVPQPEPVVSSPEQNTQSNQDQYPQHIEAIPGNTNEVWYNIPELGVRMRLNKEFAEDLVYVYSKTDENITSDQQKYTTPYHEEVNFSSRSLMDLEPACEPGTRAIGYLIKELGNINDWPASSYFLDHFQFPNFFVVLGVPSGEDNPKVPICYLSETSHAALSLDGKYDSQGIERVLDNQSGSLWKGFHTLELLH